MPLVWLRAWEIETHFSVAVQLPQRGAYAEVNYNLPSIHYKDILCSDRALVQLVNLPDVLQFTGAHVELCDHNLPESMLNLFIYLQLIGSHVGLCEYNLPEAHVGLCDYNLPEPMLNCVITIYWTHVELCDHNLPEPMLNCRITIYRNPC